MTILISNKVFVPKRIIIGHSWWRNYYSTILFLLNIFLRNEYYQMISNFPISFSLDCGGSQMVLQWFHLESAGRRIRYKFRCCRLNQNIAQNRVVNNAVSFGGRGDCRYLDRQRVKNHLSILSIQ